MRDPAVEEFLDEMYQSDKELLEELDIHIPPQGLHQEGRDPHPMEDYW